MLAKSGCGSRLVVETDSVHAKEMPASKRRARCQRRASTSPINVVIETDIGHDCDDIECLQVALKDHKKGRIRIRYISTVSCNNVNRARVVQHLCACFGITDIPILPSRREKALRDGQRLDRCTPVWMYERVGNQYRENPSKAEVSSVHNSSASLCSIHDPADSVRIKSDILKQCLAVRVLIIGPGIEVETFANLAPEDGRAAGCKRSEYARKIVERIVWQGNYNDKESFNIGSDFEAASRMQAWAVANGIPQYNIGKLVAYNTQLDLPSFKRLAEAASTHGGLDLQAHWQLGVMEFRDANRNLFNCLNFGISEPGKAAATKSAETFDESNPRHVALKRVLSEDSLNTSWFEALSKIPPMYDLTAYLLLRDAGSTSAGLADEEMRADENVHCDWYKITKQSPTHYSVGSTAPDILLDPALYMQRIEGELMEAMVMLAKTGAVTEPPGRDARSDGVPKRPTDTTLIDDVPTAVRVGST